MNLPRKNALEWMVFGLSLVLVVSLVGFLAYEARVGGGEPELAVELGVPIVRAGRLEVPVAVINRGQKAVEDVLIEVLVRQTGIPEERAELTVPLLAEGSSEEGLALVSASGELQGLEGRVISFRVP